MDLLGLRRATDGTYRFVILELKLGKNPELSGKVADQLQFYVDHLRQKKVLAAYADCYEEVYRQKHLLGLLGEKTPATVRIDRADVDALIVVGGYGQQASSQIAELKRNHPKLSVIQLDNNLSKHV